eukprot:3795690-Prymnesium_polylepis.1
MLHTRSIDPFNVAHLVRQRAVPCIEAHSATAVSVGHNAPEMLQKLSYEQAFELLRKGYVLRHQRTTLRVFQVCWRPDAAAGWEPLNDMFAVEAV